MQIIIEAINHQIQKQSNNKIMLSYWRDYHPHRSISVSIYHIRNTSNEDISGDVISRSGAISIGNIIFKERTATLRYVQYKKTYDITNQHETKK